MKKVAFIISVCLSLLACKNENTDKSTSEKEVETKPLSILEKVANAHGIDRWKDVNEIQYVFNVQRDSNHYARSWSWKPKTAQITMNDTISYSRKGTIDSTFIRADQGFINDKYWLLAPFNLIWDQESFTYTHEEKATAPISKTAMQKLTIVYKSEGGYTPGDAYDFYFGKDFVIKEWAFREANAPEAGLITSWEDYETFNGLKIAKTHNRDAGSWKLYFTDIKVN